ncbi:tRNA uridine-5-carboxymethylaminomethyl(34) synthesis GTPase MnmE [uncultured Pseudoramibacter sp.]|jgi:tRNA modification GTPase|uniref:tRNA uridine-5-carboxymethylaminomethyl(34) synthesis GTPase MnmE n=1 Tax=uncultured Pseudoramibacter sp. TaxID=1623493 RepID=UPI0025ECE2FE|nr:tRNA uridine-5-carboxymethylaminomethyl(34) synthesis GTPase MnmE [uncultured Pseudoramibacter sp.]
MNNVLSDDVIAAISTPVGTGGIGIVRLSGAESLQVADRVFMSPSGKSVTSFPSHTIHYGHVVGRDGAVIDEVMLTVMRAPKTYTREDIVEINCHGGNVVVGMVLQAVIDAGARLADPGEFTQRAFVNGRIDLSQAEAVMDVIDAKTEAGVSYSLNQLSGGLSKKYQGIDDELLHLLTYIDAALDYPEYDVEEVTEQELDQNIHHMIDEIDELLQSAKVGKVVRDGIDTVILGEPNVGKSSLMNKLLHEEKALVTNIPGTTRDTIEDYLNIGGVPFHIIDTAGIRETDDVIEKMGVERAKQMVNQAELVLYIEDVSRETSNGDQKWMSLLEGKKVLHIYNKSDLIDEDDQASLKDHLSDNQIVLSVKREEGLQTLKHKMVEMAVGSDSVVRKDDPIVSNVRHISLLKQVRQNLESALESMAMGMSVDIVAIDLKDALDNLRKITGQSLGDDIIDQIFANFCLGK